MISSYHNRSKASFSLYLKMRLHAERYIDAHIYYFRRIMHNYQDHTCTEIFKNIALAMSSI